MTTRKLGWLALCFLGVWTPVALGQSSVPAWVQTWNGPADRHDRAISVRALADGGSVTLAKTTPEAASVLVAALLRHGPTGDLRWQYVDEDLRIFEVANQRPFTPQVELLDAGSALLLGLGAADRMTLTRVDLSTGEPIWTRTRTLIQATRVQPRMTVDPTTGAIVVAALDQGDVLLLGFDADGNSSPDRRIGRPEVLELPYELQRLADGALAIAGVDLDSIGLGPHANYFVVGVDANGQVSFDRRFPISGNMGDGVHLAAAADGSSYLLGNHESTCGVLRAFLWRLSPTGDVVWARSWPENLCANTKTHGMATGPDGSIAVFRDGLGNGNRTSMIVSRFSTTGDPLWERAWSGDVGSTGANALVGSINSEGRIRISGLERLPFPSTQSRFSFAEWTMGGDACTSGHQDGAFWGEGLTATSTGWLHAAYGRGQPPSSIFDDVQLLAYQRIASCAGDVLFADGFDGALK